MKPLKSSLLIVSLVWPVTVLAQLPAPTAEEAAKQAAAAEEKALSEEAAKSALAKAQDRVAQRYRATHPGAPKPVPVVAPAAAGK